ncbi:DUF3303 domain-containing protein [Gordonia rhizosphera]|uniref:DUF3303 domain-containing protein n=1 Tax=Gordonia rhizosphera NBRC 16068 TaxID=1108045 RepID=K6VR76_9ACTN|nr:DUF3303 family protein [Gordonia rhizosphera]GAB89395.1 hypothetical protein GORHZ_060_00270 [Gordonia rhizosphera NBRC 16068]
MKYVISWTTRANGSEEDNDASFRRALALFSKWQPPESETFHQFVGRLDGNGGFAVVETDNPTDVLEGAEKFGTTNEFQVYPVIDINNWVQVAQEGVDFRESIS